MMKQMGGAIIHGINDFADSLRPLHSRSPRHYTPLQKFDEMVRDRNGIHVHDTGIGIQVIFRYDVILGEKTIWVTYLAGMAKQELFLCKMKYTPYTTKHSILANVQLAMGRVIHHRLYLARKVIIQGMEMRGIIENCKDVRNKKMYEQMVFQHATGYANGGFRYSPDNRALCSEPVFVG